MTSTVGVSDVFGGAHARRCAVPLWELMAGSVPAAHSHRWTLQLPATPRRARSNAGRARRQLKTEGAVSPERKERQEAPGGRAEATVIECHCTLLPSCWEKCGANARPLLHIPLFAHQPYPHPPPPSPRNTSVLTSLACPRTTSRDNGGVCPCPKRAICRGGDSVLAIHPPEGGPRVDRSAVKPTMLNGALLRTPEGDEDGGRLRRNIVIGLL